MSNRPVILSLLFMLCAMPLRAQENYEIQVYESETTPAGVSVLELHSNFTFDGTRETVNGLQPTHHALHETLEFSHGITPWLELAAYMFTSFRSGDGLQIAGFHLRPRARIPEEWHWPVGIGFAAEIGWQRRYFSESTVGMEFRPIIDKAFGDFYLSVNPVLEAGLNGDGEEVSFAPGAMIAWDISSVVRLGLEYYSGLGPLKGFVPRSEQQHLLCPSIDLNLSPDWEFSAGIGFGLNGRTDNLIIKAIVGRILP